MVRRHVAVLVVLCIFGASAETLARARERPTRRQQTARDANLDDDAPERPAPRKDGPGAQVVERVITTLCSEIGSNLMRLDVPPETFAHVR